MRVVLFVLTAALAGCSVASNVPLHIDVTPSPGVAPTTAPTGAPAGAQTMLGAVQSFALMPTLQDLVPQMQLPSARARAQSATCRNRELVVTSQPSPGLADVTASYFYDNACTQVAMVAAVSEQLDAHGSLQKANGTLKHYGPSGALTLTQTIAVTATTDPNSLANDPVVATQVSDSAGDALQSQCEMQSTWTWWCGAAFIARGIVLFPFAELGAAIGPMYVDRVAAPSGTVSYGITGGLAPVFTRGALIFTNASLSITNSQSEQFGIAGGDFSTSGDMSAVAAFGPGNTVQQLSMLAVNPTLDLKATFNGTSQTAGTVLAHASSPTPTTVATITLDGYGNGTLTEPPTASSSGFTMNVAGFAPSP